MSLAWWKRGSLTIDDERAAFEAAGLNFAVDDRTVAELKVVIFRGHLRRGVHQHPATVVYPPSYLEGGHPLVFAKALDLGRHSDPETGLMCLDHLDPDEHRPMNGATSVRRAEELWRLTVEDPDALAALETDTPNPTLPKYRSEPASSIFLLGADVAGHDHGWARIKGYHMPNGDSDRPSPVRGQILGLGADTITGTSALFDATSISSLAGPSTILGVWGRLAEPPPWRDRQDTLDSVIATHGQLLAHAVAVARTHRRLERGANWTFIALVFPDEMKIRGQQQDAWLVVAYNLDSGKMVLAPVTALQPEDTFDRQPGMRPLADKHVVCVGLGALGSEIADLLGRAGVGRLDLLDPDRLEPGNVVRHALTLENAGWAKTTVMQEHLRAINPFIHGVSLQVRVGAAPWPPESSPLHEKYMDLFVGADLLVNATASQVTSRWIASYADALRVPVLHVAVSAGAWSARAFVQRPGASGCPECLGLHQRNHTGAIPGWTEDPDGFGIVGLGCNQPTFSAPGFEIVQAAATAARMVVQVLLNGDGYPPLTYDMATMILRDGESSTPTTTYTALPRHAECLTCAP